MSLHRAGVVVVLAAGNLLLWGDRFTPRAERSFDFAGFQEQAVKTLPASQLASLPFENNPLLPDEYVYLQASDQYVLSREEDEEISWFSVYVGYYPQHGLTGKEPHDPRVCYEVAQFSTLQHEFMELRHPEREDPLFVNRLLVEHHSRPDADGKSHAYRRVAFYWSHSMGHMPGEGSRGLGPLGHVQERLLNRRSDLVWVRVELLLPASLHGQELPRELDPETTHRLYRVMRAAAASML